MPALPAASAFTGSSVTEGDAKAAFNTLRAYLADLFGTDGLTGTALASLGAALARYELRSAAAAVTTADRGKVIAATGTWTAALPTAASAGAGFSLVIRNAGTGAITLDPAGSELIDGAATLVLAAGQAALVVGTGTEWITLTLPGRTGGALIVNPGTAVLPGLSFPGDTDTGLARLGADILGLIAGGAERARLTAAGMQLTGLLSGTAVTQSPTDQTVGRLLKVGDFGLGATGALSTTTPDLQALGNGLYTAGVANFAAPPFASGTAFLIHHRGGTTAWQLAVNPSASLRAVRARIFVSGAWSDWATLFDQGTVIGTVSQAGGTPTGALIERGANANGRWRRWACGFQECWRTDLAAANAATADGQVFRSADVGWTFPAAFAAGTAPVVTGAVDDIDCWLSCGAPTDTAVTLRAKASVSKAGPLALRARAVGRWADI